MIRIFEIFNQKQASLNKKAMSTIIYMIIAVFVLVVAVIGASKSFGTLYSGFRGWNALSETQQKDIENNFQIFADKIKDCKNIDDRFCKCDDVFTNFPNSFSDEVSIDSLQENTNIYLLLNYNKNKIENSEKELGLGSLFFVRRYKEELPTETGEIEVHRDEMQEIREENSKLEITFDKDYPEILGKDKKYSLSSGDVFRGNFGNVLYLIVDDKEFFEEYPKCLDKRKDAIALFDSFISSLEKEGEIKVNLPSDYSIYYGNKFFKLRYKAEDIERMYDKDNKKLEKMEKAIEIYGFSVRCENPFGLDSLSDGDNVKAKKTEEGFCIEKVLP